jgi:cell division protein FtsA
MPKMAESVLGLDIGTNKISAVVCELPQAHEVLIRGLGRSATAGLDHTGITDEDLLSQSVMRAVQRAIRVSSIKPSRVVVGLPTFGARFVINAGVLSIQNVSGTVREEDMTNCVKRALQVIREPHEIMVHGSAIETRLDGHAIEDPVGKAGRQLDVTTRVIFSDQRLVDTITRIVKNLGFHVAGLSYDQFGAGAACLSDAERQYGALLIDIGSTWTQASIFQKGTLAYGSILPIGGHRISKDIAQCLRVSPIEAERIKLKYGHVLPLAIPDGDIIPNLASDSGTKDVRRRVLVEIIRARMRETLLLVHKKMKHMDMSGVPVVLAGGGSNIPGLGILASEIFESPVRLGVHPQFHHTIRNPEDHVAVGVVLYGMKTGAIQVAPTEAPTSWWQRFVG